MVVAECPNIFDVQCICGKIFVSLEKIFSFKYSWTIYYISFSFYVKYISIYIYIYIYIYVYVYIVKRLQELSGHIFLGTHTVQTVLKYI